jgi:LysM repeat protein
MLKSAQRKSFRDISTSAPRLEWLGKNDSAVVYTVNRGDTLSKIGARFHVTVHQILQANPFIANPNLISVGMRIRLPQKQVAPPAAVYPTTNAPGMAANGPGTAATQKIAWGSKVTATFKAKVIKICGNLGVDPNYLMGAMAFESAETFSPSVKNAQSGATGLIQFMPSTAQKLGTSTGALAGMSAEAQLDYVEKYFQPHTNKLSTLEDLYMAILWPAAIGKSNSEVLFSKPSTAYTQNAGLDANNDGKITKEEAAARVRAKLEKGLAPNRLG